METTSTTDIQFEYKDLLDAGVHFGHLTRKWNPKMASYIFMERNGIHIIDLNKTMVALNEAIFGIKNMVRNDRKVLFVATKKQAKDIVTEIAQELNQPYVTDRWLGGMLTNFATIRRSLVKMQNLEKHMKDESFQNLAKRERLLKMREFEKQQRILGGIKDMNRLPAAMFVVDVMREHIAVSEAIKLGIPVFAMVDTNSDPDVVDYAIPANDDAYKSIRLVTSIIGKAIEEGLMERKQAKEAQKEGYEEEDGSNDLNAPSNFDDADDADDDEDKPKRRRKPRKTVAETKEEGVKVNDPQPKNSSATVQKDNEPKKEDPATESPKLTEATAQQTEVTEDKPEASENTESPTSTSEEVAPKGASESTSDEGKKEE